MSSGNVAHGRRRRVRVDFRVDGLTVPTAWHVGRATFRPPGWLEARIVTDLAKEPRQAGPFTDFALEGLSDWKWSSVSVTTIGRRGETATDDARQDAEDAVAVGRLYQRACVPNWGMDVQTFGLVGDVGTSSDIVWQSDFDGVAGVSGRHRGPFAQWGFTRDQVRGFRSRPGFAFLDDALRTPDAPPGSWQQRGITALRALNLASPAQSQPIRIVLQAVALEALLGDDPPANRRDFRPQAHPVAQRAAFLTCEVDGLRLPPTERACANMTARTANQAEQPLPKFGVRPTDYWDWPCTAYWHIRQVFDARNDALHDARDHFPRRTAMRFEGRVDDVILGALDWAATTGATGISDLTALMDAEPRP